MRRIILAAILVGFTVGAHAADDTDKKPAGTAKGAAVGASASAIAEIWFMAALPDTHCASQHNSRVEAMWLPMTACYCPAIREDEDGSWLTTS